MSRSHGRTWHLDAAVSELNRIARRSGLRTARELGAFLIDRFFEGDTSRAECAREQVSFRRLAKRRDLLVSATSLYRAVAIELQVRAMPESLASALTASHHRELLVVRDRELVCALAREAVREGMTTRQLAARVRMATGGSGPTRRGRPRTPEVLKSLRRMQTAAAEARDQLMKPAAVDDYPEHVRAEASQALAGLLRDVRLMHASLGAPDRHDATILAPAPGSG